MAQEKFFYDQRRYYFFEPTLLIDIAIRSKIRELVSVTWRPNASKVLDEVNDRHDTKINIIYTV